MQKLSENFYNNYYSFSLNANTISNELFLKFIEKIKESENLESYALTIIDLLNDESNSNYVLSNLKSLVNSSDKRLLEQL
jgi:hypothetical protein